MDVKYFHLIFFIFNNLIMLNNKKYKKKKEETKKNSYCDEFVAYICKFSDEFFSTQSVRRI